jgi:hypothetical protein
LVFTYRLSQVNLNFDGGKLTGEGNEVSVISSSLDGWLAAASNKTPV